MDKIEKRRSLRREFNSLGWALVIYLLILNAVVMVFAVIDMIMISVRQVGGEVFTETQIDSILMGNGFGYLMTILIGMIILRVWQGRAFCRKILWTRGRPMKVSDFLCLTCVFLAGQMAFQVTASVQEAILNQFGLSALDSIETATMSVDTLSMFLYSCLGAPIAEEILFRGLILRKLEPHGKRFAVIMSAFAFAVFHGNLVQIPYAFLVGLILGYVAVEYNILWSMVLHMINNLVLGDMLQRLTAGLGSEVAAMILWAVIIISALAAVVILLVRRKAIRRYHQENPVNDDCVAAFFTSPGILVLNAMTLITLVISLL